MSFKYRRRAAQSHGSACCGDPSPAVRRLLGRGTEPARPAWTELRADALRTVPFARQVQREPTENRAPIPHLAHEIPGGDAGGGAGRRYRHRPSVDAGVPARTRSNRRFHCVPEDARVTSLRRLLIAYHQLTLRVQI